MNEEDRLIVSEFKARVAQLIEQYNLLEGKKQQLEEENKTLKEKIEALLQENDQLEHKYDNLRIAKFIDSGYNDNQDAKQRIDKLLREIDKCIALLNQ
jgi:wobble nucleotide-excising tRNase